MYATAADPVRFAPSSDQSLLIYFGERISLQAHERIRKFLRLLEIEPISGIRNLHPAYCSLLIKFDPLQWRHDDLEKILKQYLGRLQDVHLPAPRQLVIPVCYGGEYGPDLIDVGAIHKLTPDQVIELHSSNTYVVYFLGFVPGFAYLGELPKSLVTPRLSAPRRRVPSGSVGIAGSQTGIYPVATPGGWRLLGRTPLSIFRPDNRELSLVSIGDHVRFSPISPEQFATLVTA